MRAREQVGLAVEVFRMLSDATRVQLLWALLDGEMPVNDLAEAVGKPASGVSQHLAKLRMARLVSTRRQANQVFYRSRASTCVSWSRTRSTRLSTPPAGCPNTTAQTPLSARSRPEPSRARRGLARGHDGPHARPVNS